ncbi:MAG: hypothetical protein QOE14_1184 [Humisphaera sp.]|nr:hypothetical protein [Humisphaera sp.]
MRTIMAFVMLLALVVVMLFAAVGCSKYEFNDPTGAQAKVVYDHTGTAAEVEQQQSQSQASAAQKTR